MEAYMYLQLIATASVFKGLSIETLGWEAFEKGYGNKPIKDLLKGEAFQQSRMLFWFHVIQA